MGSPCLGLIQSVSHPTMLVLRRCLRETAGSVLLQGRQKQVAEGWMALQVCYQILSVTWTDTHSVPK